MRLNENNEGFDIYVVRGWDYASLCETYEKGIKKIRETHIPAIFHIVEVTQPQGHSTSGSHERYKSAERLAWEKEYDCIQQMKLWILSNNIANQEQLQEIERTAKDEVNEAKKSAWKKYSEPIKSEIKTTSELLQNLYNETNIEIINEAIKELNSTLDPYRRDIMKAIHKSLRACIGLEIPAKKALNEYLENQYLLNKDRYNSYLYSHSSQNALSIEEIPAIYSNEPNSLNGFEIINKCFDNLFTKYDNVVAFGEDVGKIGDVNQGFAGLQEKFGKHRIFDVGIREATIMGQAIGLAMRGIRPIAEIQYLDYLIYGLQPFGG